jgi:hypothetical protein
MNICLSFVNSCLHININFASTLGNCLVKISTGAYIELFYIKTRIYSIAQSTCRC